MNTFLIYILESTVCISVFYLLFRLLMSKETSFAVNRATLLAIVVASVIVPLVQLPQVLQTPVHVELIPEFSGNKIQIRNLPVTADGTPVEVQPSVLESTPAASKLTIPLKTVLQYFYLFGVLVALLIFIRNVFQIVLLSRKATVQQMDGYRLLIIDREVPSFAFGRSVIISRTDYDAHGSAILAHEQAHIQLNHFFDLILLELVRTIHWFNPAIYALIGDLKEIHEFQADQHTLNKGIDAIQYQKLIIQKGVGSLRFALANSFNHCQIKKRITMMNKSKNSKAWRWKVATFLPLLALLLVFCGRKSGNEPPNSVQFKGQTFSINRCEIANESVDNTSKFGVDLFITEKGNSFTDTTNKKSLIRLSIISRNSSDLEDGEYQFSSESVNTRASMTFSGIVVLNNEEIHITEGNLICKRDSSNKVNFMFKLRVDENNRIDGNYFGSFVYTNGSLKSRSEKMPTPQPKPKIKTNESSLFIEFREDGNYIDDQLYSREDFIRKVKELTANDKNDKNSFVYLCPDFELSDSQNIEITAISNATGIPFVPNFGVDQQAVFPGGNKGMFAWIKQNSKYPIQNMAFSWSKNVTVEFIVNAQGKAVEPKIVEAINPELNSETIRVIFQMPAWKPAMKNGIPVNVKRRLSIPFK